MHTHSATCLLDALHQGFLHDLVAIEADHVRRSARLAAENGERCFGSHTTRLEKPDEPEPQPDWRVLPGNCAECVCVDEEDWSGD